MRSTYVALCAVAAIAALLTGCAAEPGAPPAAATEDPAARAARLSREFLLVDTHVDVPYRLVEKMEDVSVRTEGGDFDYPRAVEGGLDAPFMSIYVPARFQQIGGAREHADRLIDMVEKFETDWPDKFAVARSVADVRRIVAAGRIALPMGMENGAPVEDDLANLAHFHRRGIRYITLTHSEDNQICDSSYVDPEKRTWGGLSTFGREVVAEMNRLGIMIDVSHLSDDAFYQVMELSRAPAIASHSSCRAFTPGFERNMDDRMIRLLAEKGGVIGINFGSAFLTEESNRRSREMWQAMGTYFEEHEIDEEGPEAEAVRERFRAEYPPILADVEVVADHFDHVVELVGVDHVGLGSDFDGVGPTTPIGLEDASRYPNLLRVLLERGYSEEDLRKIWGENFLRVWAEVERLAEEPAAPA